MVDITRMECHCGEQHVSITDNSRTILYGSHISNYLICDSLVITLVKMMLPKWKHFLQASHDHQELALKTYRKSLGPMHCILGFNDGV